MATYWQWYKGYTGESYKPRRLTWICGPEVVLREQIIGITREAIGSESLDLDVLQVETKKGSEAAVWSAINQYPSGDGRSRTVIVRDAEKLKSWPKLADWLENSRLNPNTYVIMVSDVRDLDTENEPLSFCKGRTQVHMVKCVPPAYDHIDEWCAMMFTNGSSLDVSHSVMHYLVERVGGNPSKIIQTLDKLRIITEVPTQAHIDVLTERTREDLYIEALQVVDRPSAMEAALQLSEKDILLTIGRVEAMLRQSTEIASYVRRGSTTKDIAARTSIPVPVIVSMMGAARQHTEKSRVRRSMVLAQADSMARRGVLGTLVYIASNW